MPSGLSLIGELGERLHATIKTKEQIPIISKRYNLYMGGRSRGAEDRRRLRALI